MNPNEWNEQNGIIYPPEKRTLASFFDSLCSWHNCVGVVVVVRSEISNRRCTSLALGAKAARRKRISEASAPAIRRESGREKEKENNGKELRKHRNANQQGTIIR